MFISLHTIYNIIFSDRMDHFLLSVSKGYYTTIPKTKITIFKPNLPAQPSDTKSYQSQQYIVCETLIAREILNKIKLRNKSFCTIHVQNNPSNYKYKM